MLLTIVKEKIKRRLPDVYINSTVIAAFSSHIITIFIYDSEDEFSTRVFELFLV